MARPWPLDEVSEKVELVPVNSACAPPMITVRLSRSSATSAQTMTRLGASAAMRKRARRRATSSSSQKGLVTKSTAPSSKSAAIGEIGLAPSGPGPEPRCARAAAPGR